MLPSKERKRREILYLFLYKEDFQTQEGLSLQVKPLRRYSVSLWAFGNVPQIIHIFFGLAIQSKRVFVDPLLGMNNT